jgi:predicted DNA-binding protein
MTTLTFQLADDTYEWLDKAAQQHQKSRSNFVKEILELYREDYEDGQLALQRLNQDDAKYLTTEQLEAELGI